MRDKNYHKQWAEANEEHLKEYRKQWYLNNKERMQAYYKTYKERHSDERKEYLSKYYSEHKDEIRKKQNEYKRKCYQENSTEEKKRTTEWRRNTKLGRATCLLHAYNQADENRGRGKGDLTAQWIIDNIFSKPCTHCGETDWTKIGCNRLDNSKPHTKDNVEPCCGDCNIRLGLEHIHKLKSKIVYQYTLDNELVAIYCSTMEAARQTGFSQGNISQCCKGKLNNKAQYKGYKWSYTPL